LKRRGREERIFDVDLKSDIEETEEETGEETGEETEQKGEDRIGVVDLDTSRTGIPTGMDLDSAEDEMADTVLAADRAAVRDTLNPAVPATVAPDLDTDVTGMILETDSPSEMQEDQARMIDVDDLTPGQDLLCREMAQPVDVKAKGDVIRDRSARAREVGLVLPDLEGAPGPGRTLPTLLDLAHVLCRHQDPVHHTRKVIEVDLVPEASAVKAIREVPPGKQSRRDAARVHESRRS
jgi:hypothetical protein